MNLKEIFIDKLANRPYCTDDLNYGLTIRNKLVAKEKKYIQANQPYLINWLCFDIDYPCILETTFEEKFLPAPNFMIVNPPIEPTMVRSLSFPEYSSFSGKRVFVCFSFIWI